MPKPRKIQISLDAAAFYHCVSRCVRRAFLCGKDISWLMKVLNENIARRANKEDECSGHYETLQPKSLMPFVGNLRHPMPKGLMFNLIDYIESVDWTGRMIRDDKRGAIGASTPPILHKTSSHISRSFSSRYFTSRRRLTNWQGKLL